MKKLLLIVLAGMIAPALQARQQTDTSSPKKLAWWQEGKFGLFLHWGLYSVTAGDWKGHPTKGGEHFMLYERIPVKEYAGIAKDFNPVKYNADTWVRLAHEAGMRYIVITAKHHDGFAMYNSSSSHYNIVALTPYHHDPMKDLAAACKKYGVKLCFYYSLGRDWEDPDVPTNWPSKGGRSNTWDYPNEDAKDIAKYVARKVKPQLHELLTQYGPVAIIWFDTPELITAQQSKEIKELVHSLQPDCIVNSRIGNGLGDYNVSEQKVPDHIIQQPWEACMTISANWGYNRYDSAWKSAEVLLRQLTDVVSKGGNLLLNVSPTGTGIFPDSSVARLKAVGRWIKVNKEAIYGTKPWRVFGEYATQDAANKSASKPGQPTMVDAVNDAISKNTTPDLRFTQKGNTIYLIARSWHQPTVVSQSFSGINIKSIRLVGYSKKIQWKQEHDVLTIQMPVGHKSEVPVYVFAIQ